jgi:hypothetical protein
LKRKCRAKAADQGKHEYQWVTEILCKELGMTVESLAVLDSALEAHNENGQGTIRPSSPAHAGKAAKENLRHKGPAKGSA